MIRLLIDEKLKEKGKSQYWLAQQSGIPSSTLYRYCRTFRCDTSGELLRDESGRLAYESTSIRLQHLGRLHKTLKADPGNLIKIARDGTTRLAINEILKKMGKSLMWLSRAQHTDLITMWNLTTNQRAAINLDILEKLYRTLECRKSELIEIISEDSDTN